MEKRLIEQSQAIDSIVPYITAYGAELHNPTRPLGVFFLLGPTGVGKTVTVEKLAEILHGDKSKMVRLDCAQFELSHDVAKMTGSPPGYLGHKDTVPLLTRKKLKDVTSETCDISIVLFDEIEKAHATFYRTLLSVLDKGELTNGDNEVVDFKKSLVFFTSNLGAAEMRDTLEHRMGFSAGQKVDIKDILPKLESIGKQAAKKRFTPEFYNRIDEVITYKPLSETAIARIYEMEIGQIRARLFSKTDPKHLFLVVSEEVSKYLIQKGFSDIHGARELNRVIHRCLTQPLSDVIVDTVIADKSILRAELEDGKVVFQILGKDELKKMGLST